MRNETLISVRKEPYFQFFAGQKILLKRGNNVVGQIVLGQALGGNLKVTVEDSEGETLQVHNFSAGAVFTRAYLGRILERSTYGKAWYLVTVVEDKKVEEAPEKNVLGKPIWDGKGTKPKLMCQYRGISSTFPRVNPVRKGQCFAITNFSNRFVSYYVNVSAVGSMVVYDPDGKFMFNIPDAKTFEAFSKEIKERDLPGGIIRLRNDEYADHYRETVKKCIEVRKEKEEASKPLMPKNATRTVDTNATEQYIIWAPCSERPPRKIMLSSELEAQGVAEEMAKRHGKKFYWCKLMGWADMVPVDRAELKIGYCHK